MLLVLVNGYLIVNLTKVVYLLHIVLLITSQKLYMYPNLSSYFSTEGIFFFFLIALIGAFGLKW